MAEKNAYGAVETVLMRADTYRMAFKTMTVIALILALTTALSVTAATYLALTKPEPRYFATSLGGKILPLVPLDQPHLSANEVVNYAIKAVTDALTYDFKNYRADFQQAQDYFTKPNGWNSFVDALEKSDQLTMVKKRRLNTTAIAQDAVIVREGVNSNDVYEWIIQIPVRMTYESASEITGQDLLVTVTMQRLQTYQSPYAAAISRFIAAPGGKFR